MDRPIAPNPGDDTFFLRQTYHPSARKQKNRQFGGILRPSSPNIVKKCLKIWLAIVPIVDNVLNCNVVYPKIVYHQN